MNPLVIIRKMARRASYKLRILRCPIASHFSYPLRSFPPEHNRDDFGKDVEGWGPHLGVDFDATPGDRVLAIGNGVIVAVQKQLGSKKKPGFGGVVVITHRLSSGDIVHSLYGHLGKVLVREGQKVSEKDVIGFVGDADTPENGWWKPQVHLGIYRGLFPLLTKAGASQMLPGHFDEKTSQYTKREYWEDPNKFIAEHNRPA